MSIISHNELRELPKMSPAELDSLDFGLIQVDDSGTIKNYNKYQSELGNVPQTSAIGKNFFTQIAPCTNNRLFFGKFKEGVAAGKLDVSIPYVFTYKLKPTNVNVQMYRDESSRTNWVLVERR